MSAPDFWSDPHSARTLIARLKSIRSSIDPFVTLKAALQEDVGLLDLADPEADRDLIVEIEGRASSHEKALKRVEAQAYFSGKDDSRDAILSIRAGTGGVDAMDWAEQLERMYWRWLTKAGYEAVIVDRLEGGEAGIHRSMIEVRGPNAHGLLRGEMGVHRICHISKFDSNGKKQTSFAAVEVSPIYPEVTVNIDELDVETETFCSGGPGGQNVNKTSSAVRVRHRPSGLMVKCQSQRSQFQNKNTALELLASKLQALEDEKRGIRGPKLEAGFGHQIRTYWLEPYQLVKDHRTDFETSDAHGVLDGDLDGISEAFLRMPKSV